MFSLRQLVLKNERGDLGGLSAREPLRNPRNAFIYDLPAGLATEYQDLRHFQCLDNLGSVSRDRELITFLLKKQSPTVEATGVALTHQHLLIRRTGSASLKPCLGLLFAKIMRGGDISPQSLLLPAARGLHELPSRLCNT